MESDGRSSRSPRRRRPAPAPPASGSSEADTAERRLLLEGARRCIAKTGAQKATLAAICKEAGLASRAVYRHFAGKAELVSAAIGEAAIGRAQRVEELAAQFDDDSLAAAEMALDVVFDKEQAAPPLADAFVTSISDPELVPFAAESMEQLIARIATLVERAQDDGNVDASVAPADLAALIVALRIGSELLGRVRPATSLEQILTDYRHITFGGFGPMS